PRRAEPPGDPDRRPCGPGVARDDVRRWASPSAAFWLRSRRLWARWIWAAPAPPPARWRRQLRRRGRDRHRSAAYAGQPERADTAAVPSEFAVFRTVHRTFPQQE